MSKIEITSDRVTIMLNTETSAKVRKVQALLITSNTGNWSFSAVLNSLLEMGIKTASASHLAEKILKKEGVV